MIRLYTDQPLAQNTPIDLTPAQANYLHTVMRQGIGDAVLMFNGKDGEWEARIDSLGRKAGTLMCVQQTKPQTVAQDIHLLFAPLKKNQTNFVVEKACEMGCASVTPVFTHYTNTQRINADRLQAVMVEAAEQCGINHIPQLNEPIALQKWLHANAGAYSLLFCNERQTGQPIQVALENTQNGAPWALLIGPEGGFCDDEARRLEQAPRATPVTLGPRILRAETAVVAALTAWQIVKGDW